jgi:hypothetical protein
MITIYALKLEQYYHILEELIDKYYSDKLNCENCPDIERCCKSQGYRVIRRHIKEELNENARERRLSERGKELYKLRKERIERSFADSKQNHGYRYAMYRGIEKNPNYTWLICAAQNMKNIVTKITKSRKKHPIERILLL